jgi:hypothetical protein
MKEHLGFVNTDKKVIWQLAQSWVHSNRVLIWCIAAPYYRHMSCDSNDLVGEAQLAVYQVISVLIEQDKDLLQTSRYFRVVYRTRCIKMAAGVAVVDKPHQDVLTMEKKQNIYLDETVIQEALLALTNRQRQISQWIFEQPKPVSFNTIADHFGIHVQSVRRILSHAIKRIEGYGHQRICENL